MQTVNVVDHGADNTGAANSDTAIESAIAALDHGSTLTIPPGRYSITGQVTLPDLHDVTIQAAGATLTLENPAPVSNGGGGVLFIEGCQRFRVSGLTIEDVSRTQGYNGLWVMDSSDGLIDNVTVKDVLWVGITVFDTVAGTSKNITIRNCNSYNARFGISSNGNAVKIHGCHVQMPGEPIAAGYYDGIMVLTGSRDNVIAGNTIMNCGAAGMYITATTNIVIMGNTVLGCLGRGIELDGHNGIAEGATIVGNVVQDNYGNINLVKARDAVVTGNRCVSTDPTRNTSIIAVNTGSSDILIMGNMIRQPHSTAMAIYVQGQCTKVELVYNHITAVKKYQAPASTHIIDA